MWFCCLVDLEVWMNQKKSILVMTVGGSTIKTTHSGQIHVTLACSHNVPSIPLFVGVTHLPEFCECGQPAEPEGD